MWGGQPVVVLRIRGRETASRGPGGAHAGSLRAPAYCRTLVGRPPECRSALHVAILCKQFVGPALCWPSPFPAHWHSRLGPDPCAFLGLTPPDLRSFVPSRKRSVESVQRGLSTGLQARGCARAPLIPRGCSPGQHWHIACADVVHPMAVTPPLPAKLKIAAMRVHSMGSAIVDWRQDRRARFRHLATGLQPRDPVV